MIKRSDNPFKTNKMSTYTDNISDNISNNKHNDQNNGQNDDKIDEFVRICRYFDIDEHEKLALSKITIFEQVRPKFERKVCVWLPIYFEEH